MKCPLGLMNLVFTLTALSSAPALADVSTIAMAANDCATVTAQLRAAEATYRNAQKDLTQAQQRCNGDFNCVYPYQTAFSQAQTSLETARDAVSKICI